MRGQTLSTAARTHAQVGRVGAPAFALLALTLAGCGVGRSAASPAPARLARTGVTAAAATSTAATTAAASPTASPAPTPVPTPPPAPPLLVVVDGNMDAKTISLVDVHGATVASANVSSPDDVQAGPDGAYWTAGGRLHRLNRDGTVDDLAAVPNTDTVGAFAVAADGAVVYAVNNMQASGAVDNSLYVLRGGQSQLLAERQGGTGAPSPDAPPGSWFYDVLGWTTTGPVVVRAPAGGCGCAAFGMTTLNGNSAVVDRTTGFATPASDDPSCPVSGFAAGGLVACFHTPSASGTSAEGVGVDELRLLRNDQVVLRFSMSTQNAAGSAVFAPDGESLAYATVPVADAGCGSWQGATQLRVLDLATGAAKALGGPGLDPLAWTADGRIIATQSTGSSPNGTVESRLVSVDPGSGAVTPVFTSGQSQTLQFVGAAAA